MPGTAEGGGDKGVVETKPLLASYHREASAMRKNRAASDGGRCYFLFYGAVRAGFSEEKTLEQKPEEPE